MVCIFTLRTSHLRTCITYLHYVHVNAYILYTCMCTLQCVQNCGLENLLIVIFFLQPLINEVTHVVVNVTNSVLGVVWVATFAPLDDVGRITEYIIIQCCRKRVKNNLKSNTTIDQICNILVPATPRVINWAEPLI